VHLSAPSRGCGRCAMTAGLWRRESREVSDQTTRTRRLLLPDSPSTGGESRLGKRSRERRKKRRVREEGRRLGWGLGTGKAMCHREVIMLVLLTRRVSLLWPVRLSSQARTRRIGTQPTAGAHNHNNTAGETKRPNQTNGRRRRGMSDVR
jgi:hypothetical protein